LLSEIRKIPGVKRITVNPRFFTIQVDDELIDRRSLLKSLKDVVKSFVNDVCDSDFDIVKCKSIKYDEHAE
jgi:hypothetical protein